MAGVIGVVLRLGRWISCLWQRALVLIGLSVLLDRKVLTAGRLAEIGRLVSVIRIGVRCTDVNIRRWGLRLRLGNISMLSVVVWIVVLRFVSELCVCLYVVICAVSVVEILLLVLVAD